MMKKLYWFLWTSQICIRVTCNNECNLMIFVSKHEGSPNVIREGLSCNLPIFSFDIGDVSEHLIGVKNSEIIFNENIKKMRKRIQDFLLKILMLEVMAEKDGKFELV